MALGRKTGGRTKGTPNKKNLEMIERVAADGITPLDYMLEVLRDEGRDFAERMDAAKAAAPYVHQRLAAVDTTVSGAVSVVIDGAASEL